MAVASQEAQEPFYRPTSTDRRTVANQQPRYDPPGGVEALLTALEKSLRNGYYSVEAEEKDLVDAKKDLANKKASYEYALASVAEHEMKVKKARRKAAEIVNALGKLDCPEEVIKASCKPLNAHDIAEWIRAE